MPIHIAITRRVRPGCEAEFQEALHAFLRDSFSHESVLGASMLAPPPGSGTREYGILRTFASEADRDAFYQSPMYRAWEERARSLTEGEAQHRQLRGLEAWFRSPQSALPPRWKMAVATLLGVFPTSLFLNLTIGPCVKMWPFLLGNLVFAAAMVAVLTWAVMPLVTRLLHSWLHSE
jgi:uncharacterized protein